MLSSDRGRCKVFLECDFLEVAMITSDHVEPAHLRFLLIKDIKLLV